MRWSSRPVLALVGLSVGLYLIGCGSRAAVRPPANPPPMVSGERLSKHAPFPAGRALPSVGSTQQVVTSGARLSVTLVRVVDPLRGSGATLPPRTRPVGVMIEIRSAGPGVYDSSATGDVSLQSSGGAVLPVLATRGMCRTALNDFDRYITSGEHRSGCVVFAVADGATLVAVRFSPHAHQMGRLTWAP